MFRTNSEDDIYGIATSVSSGFFQNIGSTRRQGFEAGLNYEDSRWSAYAQYSYIDATFRSPLLMHSPSNPYQDANGNIQVLPGDKLPLIPESRLKLGADYIRWANWSVGASLVLVSSSFYRGDESNLNPAAAGLPRGELAKLLSPRQAPGDFCQRPECPCQRYSTYGVYSDPTGVGAPGVPPAQPPTAPGWTIDSRVPACRALSLAA